MNDLLILLAVSLAVSGLGWIYFIYFFSLGYGFGISALAVTIAALYHSALTVPTILLCTPLIINLQPTFKTVGEYTVFVCAPAVRL